MSENDEVEEVHPSTDDITEDTTDDTTENTTADVATTEAPVESHEAIDEFIREYLGDEERPTRPMSAARAARRRRPDSTESTGEEEQHPLPDYFYFADDAQPGSSPIPLLPPEPPQPPKPEPLDLAFNPFKKWIEEREKAVARRVQKSKVDLDDVARMGALVYVVLEEKYSGCSAERLRPMINALLEPLEYNMRFGVHKSDDPFPGFIPLYNDHIVETDSSGLVSRWRGQTPQKTNAAIDEALGGVLFIDEAYSLVSDEGQQAIDTLVKRMEDDREDLIVILAGYPDKMKELLDTNPGLASRIGLTVDFPDYTNLELMEILDTMLKSAEYEVTDSARMRVERRLETIQRDSDFGNARTMRNIFESATRCQAVRLGESNTDTALTMEQVTELTAGDFDQAMDLVFQSKSQESSFGFGTPSRCVLG